MRECVAVIGRGMMGSSIGAMSALAGRKTFLIDINKEKAQAGRERALECIRVRAQNGLNTEKEAKEAADRLLCCEKIEEAADETGLVIEAIVEKMEAKQELFARLDALFPPEVFLCSNTSGLRITDISARCSHPERTVTTHFWLPGHLVPLVEVVMGDRTEEAVARKVRDELKRWKKMPVLVKRDLPGQLANRILQAIIREAVDIVGSGLASPEDVDAAIRYGMAMRFPEWGPLEHLDAIGLDLGLAVQESVLPDICGDKEPGAYLRRLVEEGHLGVKSKKGFYDWERHDIEKDIKKRDQFIIEAVKLVNKLDGGEA